MYAHTILSNYTNDSYYSASSKDYSIFHHFLFDENTFLTYFSIEIFIIEEMGCAMFGDEKAPVNTHGVNRSNKRTQLIDCRKKSTHALTKILENIQVVTKDLTE